MDDPAFAGMHEVSALIAGQSVGAAEAVWRGEALHAVNFAGGLHHAMPGGASGFCIYNDASLAIARLLELGAERVAYVDVDVHHGDGVQAAFWEDPRVLTISLHEHPRTLFPQTGWPEETGGRAAARAAAVNVALPAGTGDAGWLRAFHAVVPELIADFRPQVLVTQHGADTHFEDPLAHLAVSLDAQRAVQVACHELAHEYAEGRWVALGGGGYAVVDVVPRSWTHLVGIAAGASGGAGDGDPGGVAATRCTRGPGSWAPARMTDGRWPVAWRDWATGYDPADRLDQAVLATRKAVFPLRGLLRVRCRGCAAAAPGPRSWLRPRYADCAAVPGFRAPGTGGFRQHRQGVEYRGAAGASAGGGVGGPVATSREESLRSYRLFAARDPRVLLGLDPEWGWGEAGSAAADGRQVRGVGGSGAPFGARCDRSGADAARRSTPSRSGWRRSAARRVPVLLGTGHPHRLLGFYAALADALSAAGCVVLTPAQGRCVDITTRFGVRTYHLDYVRGVALVREPGPCAPVVRAGRAHPLAAPGSGRSGRRGGGRRAAAGARDRGPRMGLRGRSAGVSRPSVSPIRTIRRCSSGRPRGRCPSPFRLMTAVRSDYYRPLTRYVLNRACLSQ